MWYTRMRAVMRTLEIADASSTMRNFISATSRAAARVENGLFAPGSYAPNLRRRAKHLHDAVTATMPVLATRATAAGPTCCWARACIAAAAWVFPHPPEPTIMMASKSCRAFQMSYTVHTMDSSTFNEASSTRQLLSNTTQPCTSWCERYNTNKDIHLRHVLRHVQMGPLIVTAIQGPSACDRCGSIFSGHTPGALLSSPHV